MTPLFIEFTLLHVDLFLKEVQPNVATGKSLLKYEMYLHQTEVLVLASTTGPIFIH